VRNSERISSGVAFVTGARRPAGHARVGARLIAVKPARPAAAIVCGIRPARGLRTDRPTAMRISLQALFAPADQVVAVHDSAAAADAAVRFLGRAGYPGAMLQVVGRQGPQAARPTSAAADPLRRWGTSGAFWGLFWVALALAQTTLVVRGLLPIGVLVLTGALLLAVQTAIVCANVAPERTTHAAWHAARGAHRDYQQALAADKLLLLVSGSRSDIALARSLMAIHAAQGDAARA